MLRFTLAMGELVVYGDEPVPEVLQPIAAAVAGLEDRFRPALLHPRPPWQQEQFPSAAVWPTERQLPCFTGDLASAPQELEGVVLAEVTTLTCFVCFMQFQALYPHSHVLAGHHLGAHGLIKGRPSCRSDFATSRILALALLAD